MGSHRFKVALVSLEREGNLLVQRELLNLDYHGYSAHVVDLESLVQDPGAREALLAEGPRLIAFMPVSAGEQALCGALATQLAEAGHTGFRVVAQLVSWSTPRLLLEVHAGLDGVVTLRPPEGLIPLIRHLEGGGDSTPLRGVAWRHADGGIFEVPAESPEPVWVRHSLYEWRSPRLLDLGVAPLLTSAACAGNCPGCAAGNPHRACISDRALWVGRLVQEIEAAYRRGTRLFVIQSPSPLSVDWEIDPSWPTVLADRLEELGLTDLKLCVKLLSDEVTPEAVAALRRVGLARVLLRHRLSLPGPASQEPVGRVEDEATGGDSGSVTNADDTIGALLDQVWEEDPRTRMLDDALDLLEAEGVVVECQFLAWRPGPSLEELEGLLDCVQKHQPLPFRWTWLPSHRTLPEEIDLQTGTLVTPDPGPLGQPATLSSLSPTEPGNQVGEPRDDEWHPEAAPLSHGGRLLQVIGARGARLAHACSPLVQNLTEYLFRRKLFEERYREELRERDMPPERLTAFDSVARKASEALLEISRQLVQEASSRRTDGWNTTGVTAEVERLEQARSDLFSRLQDQIHALRQASGPLMDHIEADGTRTRRPIGCFSELPEIRWTSSGHEACCSDSSLDWTLQSGWAACGIAPGPVGRVGVPAGGALSARLLWVGAGLMLAAGAGVAAAAGAGAAPAPAGAAGRNRAAAPDQAGATGAVAMNTSKEAQASARAAEAAAAAPSAAPAAAAPSAAPAAAATAGVPAPSDAAPAAAVAVAAAAVAVAVASSAAARPAPEAPDIPDEGEPEAPGGPAPGGPEAPAAASPEAPGPEGAEEPPAEAAEEKPAQALEEAPGAETPGAPEEAPDVSPVAAEEKAAPAAPPGVEAPEEAPGAAGSDAAVAAAAAAAAVAAAGVAAAAAAAPEEGATSASSEKEEAASKAPQAPEEQAAGVEEEEAGVSEEAPEAPDKGAEAAEKPGKGAPEEEKAGEEPAAAPEEEAAKEQKVTPPEAVSEEAADESGGAGAAAAAAAVAAAAAAGAAAAAAGKEDAEAPRPGPGEEPAAGAETDDQEAGKKAKADEEAREKTEAEKEEEARKKAEAEKEEEAEEARKKAEAEKEEEARKKAEAEKKAREKEEAEKARKREEAEKKQAQADRAAAEERKRKAQEERERAAAAEKEKERAAAALAAAKEVDAAAQAAAAKAGMKPRISPEAAENPPEADDDGVEIVGPAGEALSKAKEAIAKIQALAADATKDKTGKKAAELPKVAAEVAAVVAAAAAAVMATAGPDGVPQLEVKFKEEPPGREEPSEEEGPPTEEPGEGPARPDKADKKPGPPEEASGGPGAPTGGGGGGAPEGREARKPRRPGGGPKPPKELPDPMNPKPDAMDDPFPNSPPAPTTLPALDLSNPKIPSIFAMLVKLNFMSKFVMIPTSFDPSALCMFNPGDPRFEIGDLAALAMSLVKCPSPFKIHVDTAIKIGMQYEAFIDDTSRGIVLAWLLGSLTTKFFNVMINGPIGILSPGGMMAGPTWNGMIMTVLGIPWGVRPTLDNVLSIIGGFKLAKAICQGICDGYMAWSKGYSHQLLVFPTGAASVGSMIPCPNIPIPLIVGASTAENMVSANTLKGLMMGNAGAGNHVEAMCDSFAKAFQVMFLLWKATNLIMLVIGAGGGAPAPFPGPVAGAIGSGGLILGMPVL